MTRMYMAFRTSPELAADINRYHDVIEQKGKVDSVLIHAISDRFIDEMLHAFFLGPVDALGAEGALASFINGVANIVNKASRGLAAKLLSKIDAEEQAKLGQHFRAISVEKAEEKYLGFMLDDAFANRVTIAFEAALAGDKGKEVLESVMNAITDLSIATYLDGTVNQLKLGVITRGLVATARATIRKASNSSSSHMMGLPITQRNLVVGYFQSLLLTTD